MIGAKRERIEIQSVTETADAEGQPIRTWAKLASLWARVESLSGREAESMKQITSSALRKFTVNFRTDLDVKMRVVWSGDSWNIHDILKSEDKFDAVLMTSRVE